MILNEEYKVQNNKKKGEEEETKWWVYLNSI